MSLFIRTTRLLVVLFLFWLISISLKMGLANIYFNHADNQLVLWIYNGNITQAAYDETLYSINLSTQLHPDNPQYLEAMAGLQIKAVYQGIAGSSNFNLALENYNKSLALRPLWPWAWSSKALSKWRLNEIDDELWNSLNMLSELAPYNVQAHLTIIDVGLMLIARKSGYSTKAEELTKKHYKRGMTINQAKRLIKAIVERHKAEALVGNW